MEIYAYRHLIEYSRPNESVKYSEVVEDHGWYINTGTDWRVRYTAGCAAEFLAHAEAGPGEWRVVVWRLGPDDHRDGVCAIRYDAKLSVTC